MEDQTETTGKHGSPSGILDDSVVVDQGSANVRRSKRTTKNQGPKRLGSPVKHSVKFISADDDADVNEMALEKYRSGLANVKTDKNNPMETRLKLKNSNQSQLLTSLKDKIKNSKLTVSFLTFIPQHVTQFRDTTLSYNTRKRQIKASNLVFLLRYETLIHHL